MMPLLEDRITQILESKKSGHSDTQIANAMGLDTSVIQDYESSMIQAINDVLDNDAYITESVTIGSVAQKVAQKIGLSPVIVGMFIRHHELMKQYQERKAAYIRQALKNGVSSMKRLCELARVKSPSTMWKICRRHNIKLEGRLESYGTKPEVDKLIPQGLSLSEMAEKAGLKFRQQVSEYLIRSNQYGLWKKARQREVKKETEARKQKAEALKQKTELSRKISSILKEVAYKKAYEEPAKESWAHQKTAQYFLSLRARPKRYSSQLLITIFQRYEKAMNAGEKKSLEALGSDLGLLPAAVSKILASVGVEPLYGSKDKQKIPDCKEPLIKRAFNLPMTCLDAAYFLGVKWHVVSKRFNAIGKRDHIVKPLTLKRGLNYHQVSQIYESQDAGFTKQETAGLLGIKEKNIEYAINNRDDLSPKIVDALTKLFPNRVIDKPYLLQQHT
jgi:transcriptional regulator with XRE-family HTH domain/ribosomal protein S8